MLFENVPFLDTLVVLLITYFLGVVFFFILFLILRKKNEHLSQFNNYGRIFKGSLLGGVACSFLLSIVIVTLTPTVVTIENGHKYTEKLSFMGNEGFIGFGGCYVVNNSSQTLQVIGIGRDNDINVIIKPCSTEKVRVMPEEYFGRTPTNDTPETRHYQYRRGKQKPIKGNTVFLFDYQTF